MAKLKIRKQEAISVISLEIEKGLSRADALAKVAKKWQISVRTFDRYWKIANNEHLKRQKDIEVKLQAQRTKAATDRLKRGIMAKEERLKTASEIAKGKARKAGNKMLYPTDGERIKALDYMAKIEGDYAPTKLDHTTKGDSLNDAFYQFLMKTSENQDDESK